MNPSDDTAGRASVPCPACGTLLVGDRCPACERVWARIHSLAPDDPTDEEVFGLSELPGGARRRGPLGDL